MTRPAFLARLAPLAVTIAPLALACTAGEDVYVAPPSGTAQSSLECHVAPDEDVCGRSFEGLIAPQDRTAVVGLLAQAARLAGSARERQGEIARACASVLDGLGVARPTSAPGSDARTQARSLCDAAILAIGRVDRSAFSLKASLGQCAPVSSPTCAPEGNGLLVTCAASSVTLTVAEGASAEEAADAAVLQKCLAVALNAKGWGEALAKTAASVAASANVRVDDRSAACQTTAVTLVLEATEDAKSYIELAGGIAQAIAPEL